VSSPVLRHATPDDIDGVLALWRRADAHPSATDTPHDLGRVIAAPHAAVLVAADADGVLVGSIIATFDGWRGNVYRLAVDPAQRRRGLARRLAAEAERWLRLAWIHRFGPVVVG
jgi:ribosomal protein S18 acetylase RimI-like enzyme